MKEGDKLLQQLKDLAKKRDDIGLFVFSLLYKPAWHYWIDYFKGNRN